MRVEYLRRRHMYSACDEIRTQEPIFICSQKRLRIGCLGGKGREKAASVKLFQTLLYLRNKIWRHVDTNHMCQLKGCSQRFVFYFSFFSLSKRRWICLTSFSVWTREELAFCQRVKQVFTKTQLGRSLAGEAVMATTCMLVCILSNFFFLANTTF